MLIFAVLTGGALAAATAYVSTAALRSSSKPPPASESAVRKATAKPPFVVFQHVGRDAHYAEIAVAQVGSPRAAPTFTGLVCERVYYAARSGLCLVPRRDVLSSGTEARIIGPDFRPIRTAHLAGIRSRARVSPDGRLGATTTFVNGHSYLDNGFSTITALIDMSTGKVLENLEKFEITRDGERFKAIDFNFWGVTFSRDERHFYATLSTAGKYYLVEGDVDTRQARVIASGVECPSLSPDETRIAFKRRQGRSGWRLHVLDLATKRVTPLAETHSVDDQVEWLDDERILYGLNGDVWVVRADGAGRPRIYIPDALSPAVVRS